MCPPLPPGALPPVLWGDEDHVRKLLGHGIASLGPMVAIRASLAGQPERLAALDRDFLEFIAGSNRGAPEGPVRIPYEYLLVVTHKRGA